MLNIDRLKNLRKENCYKQIEMADVLKIGRTTYAKYETGDIQPPVDQIIKISDFFGVSTDWLLNKTDDPIPPNKKNSLSPEKLKLLDGIGYAYYGGEDKELDEEDVDHILDIVRLGRELREKSKRDGDKK